MAEFVTVRHPDVEKTARVARSALAHLSGWEVVEDPPRRRRPIPVPDPESSPTEPAAPRRRTRTRRVAAAPTPSTPEQDGES